MFQLQRNGNFRTYMIGSDSVYHEVIAIDYEGYAMIWDPKRVGRLVRAISIEGGITEMKVAT